MRILSSTWPVTKIRAAILNFPCLPTHGSTPAMGSRHLNSRRDCHAYRPWKLDFADSIVPPGPSSQPRERSIFSPSRCCFRYLFYPLTSWPSDRRLRLRDPSLPLSLSLCRPGNFTLVDFAQLSGLISREIPARR